MDIRVSLNADAFMVCFVHALSTESEEIMGLLLGEISEQSIVHISSVFPLRRMDKRKDRVEPRPEQLSAATEEAERISRETGKPVRVLGWYHSHPHITCAPSHIDVETQAGYQLLDKAFIGLIFSCFHEKFDSSSKNSQPPPGGLQVGHVKVSCFQAQQEMSRNIACYVPLSIKPKLTVSAHLIEKLIALPELLLQEEKESLGRAMGSCARGDILSSLHNGAVFTQALIYIMEVLGTPLLQCLKQQLKQNELRCVVLREEKAKLSKQLSSLRGDSDSDSTQPML